MTAVRIPADVDREDRLVGGMTARQLAYVALGFVVLAGLWSVVSSFLPAPFFAFVAAPVAAVVTVLAFVRRDGLPADRLALAWWRHSRGNPRRVAAPEGIPSLPSWAPVAACPAALDFPATDVEAAGVVDLGAEGAAVVCRATSLNFGLRTPQEQEALVAAFGRWLNSLTSPVQILVRAERVDVGRAVAGLHDAAPALPHPALESAAIEHADFLADLASRRDVLRRTVLVVCRESAGTDAADMLLRRAEEASRALAGAGITLTMLDREAAFTALAHAADAESLPRPPGLSHPAEVVRGAR